MGNVKGVLFADYVRMIRSRKRVDWGATLAPEDLRFLDERIDPRGWYPMASFERMGNAILRHIAGGDLQAARLWGRVQAAELQLTHRALIAAGDPIETLNRFRVLRASFFDFEALAIPTLHDDHALVEIRYGMGAVAEEAASHQTAGFLERLVELAGAETVTAIIVERTWAGDARTRIELTWRMRRPSRPTPIGRMRVK